MSARDDTIALVEKGDELFQKGDMTGSLAAYDAALTQSPKNKEAAVGKGKALLQLGRAEEASRYLEYATRHHENDQGVWQLLGTTALAAGNGPLAVTALTNYQKLAGASVSGYTRLAVASYLNLDLEQAINYIELALLEDPKDKDARQWQQNLTNIIDEQALLVSVGRVHCRERRFDRGAALFQKALDLGNSFDAHLYLGRALLVLEQSNESIQQFQAALAIEPENLEVMADLGAAYVFADHKQQAEEIFDRILISEPGNTAVLLNKAKLLFDADNLEGAREFTDKAISATPDSPDAWLLSAQVYKNQCIMPEARLRVDHALALQRDLPAGWLVGSAVLWELDKKELSDAYLAVARYIVHGEERKESASPALSSEQILDEISELDAFIKEHPEYEHAYRDREIVYFALGELEPSLAYLDTVRKQWPEEETEHRMRQRGILLLNLGRPLEARDSFKRALEIDPDSEHAQKAFNSVEEQITSFALEKHRQFLNDGMEQCRQGKYQEGLELLKQALEIGDSFPANLFAGRALMALRRYMEAVPYFEAAVNSEPNGLDAMNNLASAYLLSDQKQEAEQVYDRILKQDSTNMDALIGKGRILIVSADLKSAMGIIDRALAVDSSRSIAWLLKAQVLEREGKPDEGRLLADHAIAVELRSVSNWMYGARLLTLSGDEALSKLYLSLLRHQDAKARRVEANQYRDNLRNLSVESEELDKFIAEHPEYGHAYRDRDAIYGALGEFDRALHYLDLVRQKWPGKDDEQLLQRRGFMLLGLGRFSEARDAFKQAVEINPNNAATQHGLKTAEQQLTADIGAKHKQLVEEGITFCKEMQFQKGVEKFKEALNLGESFAARLFLGRAYQSLKQHTEAIPHFRAALGMKPDDQEVMTDLSTSLSLIEQQKRSSDFDQILNQDPKNIEALLGKGQLLLQSADLEEAQKYIEQGIQLDASKPVGWLLRAQVLQRQGNLDEARASVDRAIAIKADSGVAWKIGAGVLNACGERALANRYLARAKHLTPERVKAESIPLDGELKEVSIEATELAEFLQKKPEYVFTLQDRALIYGVLDYQDRASYYLDIYANVLEAQLASTGVPVKEKTHETDLECANCGTALRTGAGFCDKCGTPVKPAEACTPAQTKASVAEIPVKDTQTKQVDDTQKQIETLKKELNKLQIRRKIGELSPDEFERAESDLQSKIEQLEAQAGGMRAPVKEKSPEIDLDTTKTVPPVTTSSPPPAAAQPTTCPKCGATVKAGRKFCNKCGQRM